jgi:hypothetical protein
MPVDLKMDVNLVHIYSSQDFHSPENKTWEAGGAMGSQNRRLVCSDAEDRGDLGAGHGRSNLPCNPPSPWERPKRGPPTVKQACGPLRQPDSFVSDTGHFEMT